MPIREDGTGNRFVEMELIVPGTPEQVWQAIATGPGTSAWFTGTTIEERVGGTVHFDLGPNGSSTGEVTAFDPPSRFAYVEREWAPGAPPVATEITVTARSGDRCVVRMVHSLFAATDDWDGQLEGFEGGWPAFFDVLRIYLAHFPDMPGVPAFAMASVEQPPAGTWKLLTERLGLAGADVGDTRMVQPVALAGVVERIHQDRRQRYMIVRVDGPEPGIVLLGTYGPASGGTIAAVTMFLYGDAAGQRAAAAGPVWSTCLDSLAPPSP